MLVVIGLLTGGVLVGKSLIRTAQLRAVVTEFDHYTKAVKEFQDKFQNLPGDMATATANWTMTDVFDGGGNGRIGSSDSAGVQGDFEEWFYAWPHLARAGFVDGSFTGVGSGINSGVVGENLPVSQLSPGGWTLSYYINVDVSNEVWPEAYGHVFWFGAANNTGDATIGGSTTNAVLTADEAYSIDEKIDDAKPGTGKVRPFRPIHVYSGNCTENDTTAEGQTYKTGSSDIACSLFFIAGF